MTTQSNVFQGCMPALMTPCDSSRNPDFDALVAKGQQLIQAGMSAVIYCGSMGDWPLLTDAQRQEGVQRLTEAGVPVIVGTGAQNPKIAAAHAAHAEAAGKVGGAVAAAAPGRPAAAQPRPAAGAEASRGDRTRQGTQRQRERAPKQQQLEGNVAAAAAAARDGAF